MNTIHADTLIIGAGVAGLTAAHHLYKQQQPILMLDKSRGVSGRAATRRVHEQVSDHGAQYFTVRTAELQDLTDIWLEQGHVRIWSHGFHTHSADGLVPPASGHPRYIFPDGMNKLGKLLAQNLSIHKQTQATRVKPQGQGWQIQAKQDATEVSYHCQTLLMNVPPEQALDLCHFDLGASRSLLQAAQMQPCYALILSYPLGQQPAWQGIQCLNHPVLGWIALDSSKRVDPDYTRLVLHSSHSYAQSNLETEPQTVIQDMLAALSAIEPSLQQPQDVSLHRWRYALCSKALPQPFLKHSPSLYFTGDWCGGSTIEAAYQSGLHTARDILKSRGLY